MKTLTFTLLFLTFAVAAFATADKKTLTLRLQAPNGNSDVATMYFDEGITPAYDPHEDAAFVFTSLPGIPEIFSYTLDKRACSINGCGTLQSAEVVSIGYHVGYPGIFNITGSLSNFDPTSIVLLVDMQTGDTVDLRQNFYQVALDSNDNSSNRFEVLVSSPIQYSSTPSNCANTGGTITLVPDTSIIWKQCQLLDAANQVIQTINGLDGPVTFSGLSEGSYQVVYTYNDYTATNNFYLSGNFVVASIGVPASPLYTNSDIIFNAFTTNANQYYWDFGDSTLITGVANPTQTYLTPGTYTVNLYAANSFGCSATTQVTVVVLAGNATGITDPGKKEATVIAQGKVVTVNMNDQVISANAQIEVYNLLGQAVKTVSLTIPTASLDLGNESNGIYLISIRNAGSTNTKRVFIAK